MTSTCQPILALAEAHSRMNKVEDQLAIARASLDCVSDAIVVIDGTTSRILHFNAASQILLELGEPPAAGMHFDMLRSRLRTEDGDVPTMGALSMVCANGNEYRLHRLRGTVLPVEIRSTALCLQHKEVMILVLRDISRRVQAIEELRDASLRCGITFEQAALGLAHISLDGKWSKVNRRLLGISGYEHDELLSKTVRQVTHPDDMKNDELSYRKLMRGELPYFTREKRYIRKDGSIVWVNVTSSVALERDGQPKFFIAMIEDITERKRSEERVEYLASHDPMTGLPNRRRLHWYLEKTLHGARRNASHVGVAFIDMDKLKHINDTCGHEQGDTAIKRFAQQLQQQIRGEDMVARIGGDEFVMVLTGVKARSDIEAILRRTLRALANERLDDGRLLSCSIGISVFPEDGQDAQVLIRNADAAMYQAKQNGGADFSFYSEDPAARPSPSAMALNLFTQGLP